MKAHKVFTHDLRSPIQRGRPVWDGITPYQLPVVPVDSGDAECGAGWNACAHASDALRIAGLWPDGWPSRLFAVEAPRHGVVERGNKLRAATWVVTREIADLRSSIEDLTRNVFRAGDLSEELVDEQLAWHTALGRPIHDAAAVEEGLREALTARELEWKLKKFSDARSAWSARSALTVYYASRRGWVDFPENILSRGLRDAYLHGLAVAIPTGPNELGWAMVDTPYGEIVFGGPNGD